MVKSKRDVKSPRYNKTPLVVPRPVSTRSATASARGANVKVVVRVRPPNNKEQGENSRTVVKVVDNQMLVFDPNVESEVFFYHGVKQKGRDLLKRANKNMQFVFDRVFGFDSTNNDIFHDSTQPLISSLMDGYNCSVFVYGATGAGKTHTMLGHNEHPGITFLTMEELFKKKDELKNERDFEIGITYLEVYNELVQDLLNPGSPLQLREDGKYGVTVAGIQVKRINDVEELFRLLVQGNQNRTQHPTDANAESSRSHAVFQVYLRMSIHTTAEIRLAKLSMIDLAGSERGAATGCAGARFTEGANINKSLLALGNCINSLADGHRHVPYRDSKLTRLLKDSLGGNCQTIMIANVSPSSLSYDDTYNTLKYATRAKKIKSNVKKNIVSCETHVSQYVKMVEELNKEVERLKSELNKKQTLVSSESAVDEALCKELKTLYSKKNVLLEQIHHLESSEQILLHRREMKEEANARLSGICIDSPDLHQGHKQLESAVERLHRQEDCFKKEITHLRHNMSELDTKIEEFLKNNPSLKDVADKEDFMLKQKIYEHKIEHVQKLNKIQHNELQMRGKLMERMSKMLQPLFLQLRGHGLATNASIAEYQELVRSVRGIRNVTWDDDIPDSEVENSTTFIKHEEEKKTTTEDSATSTSSLNDTFIMPTTKPVKVCADQLMAKVCKPPAKRMFKIGSGSPRLNKENRVPPKRLIGTMGTAQRFASATDKKGVSRIRNAIQPLTHTNTPSKQKGKVIKRPFI